jgi:Holliday junction resolvase-like predicted endonuclease
MAACDVFHEAVKNALVKDGWTITHDPLALSFGEIDLYIDLGAERVLSAERDGQRIAVEIKSFNGPSPLGSGNVRSTVSIVFSGSV